MTRESDTSDPGSGMAEGQGLRRLFHDMRTPLNIIIGWADLMARGEVDPVTPQQREILGYILEAGQQMQTLVERASLEARSRLEGEPTE